MKYSISNVMFQTESIDIDWLERAIDADSCAAILLTIYDDDDSMVIGGQSSQSQTRRLPAAVDYAHLSDWLVDLFMKTVKS